MIENNEPIQDLPCRSTRVPIPTARSKPDEVLETRVQRAVRESRESAERIRAQKAEHRQAIDELHRERGQDHQDAAEDNLNVDQLLATLNAIEDEPPIEPGNVDPQVPKTWRQAQASPDASRWKAAYVDELKSLKDMGVYRLVPREEVPSGYRIHCGRPVFALP